MVKSADFFSDIVRDMKAAGAFDSYERPPGPERTAHPDILKRPDFPGAETYGHGPLLMDRGGIDIPQGLINAHRESFVEALDLYIPERKWGAWTQAYFSKDFLYSRTFLKLVKQRFKDPAHDKLDKSLTLNFNHRERVRTDRHLFTDAEIGIAFDVYKKQPTLVLTIIAFQASFVEYLGRLKTAIAGDDNLTELQKERGRYICTRCAEQFAGENFVNNILPAIALHYYVHTNGRLDRPPEESDFVRGMTFGIEKGMFNHTTRATDGSERRFVCPAKAIISRSAAHTIGPAPESPPAPGSGLFALYQTVSAALNADTFIATELTREVNDMIDKARATKGSDRSPSPS